MRHIATYLSLLALIGVGVLFYFHFSDKKTPGARTINKVSRTGNEFRIAYFDIDSLQEKYNYFQDVSGEMKRKE